MSAFIERGLEILKTSVRALFYVRRATWDSIVLWVVVDAWEEMTYILGTPMRELRCPQACDFDINFVPALC